MWLQPSKDSIAFSNMELSLYMIHCRYQERRSHRESSVMTPQVRKWAPSKILQRHTKASWALQTNLTLIYGNVKNSNQRGRFQIPHNHNVSLNMSTFFIYLKGENAPPSLIIEMLFECDALKAALVLHCGNQWKHLHF